MHAHNTNRLFSLYDSQKKDFSLYKRLRFVSIKTSWDKCHVHLEFPAEKVVENGIQGFGYTPTEMYINNNNI